MSFVAIAFIGAVLALWIAFKFLVPRGRVGNYNNKYVLITGCDTGFGRDTAIRLDQMGFNVFGACLTDKGIKSLKEACSGRLVAFLMDVTKHEQIEAAYAKVKSCLPPDTGLWALDNNAGYMGLGPLEWFTMDDYKMQADINLWGLIDVTKTFLPLIKVAKGRVVNFSSIAGVVTPALRAAYSVTKYGVESFSDALRREMAPYGIRVSIIQPMPFKTALWAGMAERKLMSLWDNLSEEMKQEYGIEYRDKVCQSFEKNFNNASAETHLVIDDVIDAITSCDPQTRYRVGTFTKVFTFLASLPTAVLDTVYQIRSPVAVPQGAKNSK
ncbi:retinol dehydrogenase 7-like [Nematostella vectensis]|uniref:retinol dehydrogenase 7-like n=1 Tax=Nematostella vectensis TaxID=45351 RepID=UPI002076ED7C|nr:retinol dehydrogenase 7-like [Nematostella vectensis]